MYNDDPIFTAYDYPIGGKLVVGKAVFDASYGSILHSDPEARHLIKTRLVQQMATFMLENKLVEFTQMKDPSTYDTVVIARAYLAPDEQVKILRVARKI